MKKLIRLELRRNKLKPYIIGSLSIFIFSIFMGVFFSMLPFIEPNDSTLLTVSEGNMLIQILSILSMSCFTVLSTVMYAKFIIEEYTGKKNILLFTYPQKRSDILLAKFIFICGFTFTSMCISNLLTLLFVGLLGNVINLSPNFFTAHNMISVLSLSILFALLTIVIGTLALRIGFEKKSTLWAIVSSVILIIPFGNSFMIVTDSISGILVVVVVVLLILCLVLFLGLSKRVDQMECF